MISKPNTRAQAVRDAEVVSQRPVHVVECRGGPVQDFDEAERLQAAGAGDLLEQRPQHRGAEMLDRFAPIEGGGRDGPLAPSEHARSTHAEKTP